MTYVSNSEREDMIRAIEEFLAMIAHACFPRYESLNGGPVPGRLDRWTGEGCFYGGLEPEC